MALVCENHVTESVTDFRAVGRPLIYVEVQRMIGSKFFHWMFLGHFRGLLMAGTTGRTHRSRSFSSLEATLRPKFTSKMPHDKIIYSTLHQATTIYKWHSENNCWKSNYNYRNANIN